MKATSDAIANKQRKWAMETARKAYGNFTERSAQNHPSLYLQNCVILRVIEVIHNEVLNLIIIDNMTQLGTHSQSSGFKTSLFINNVTQFINCSP